MFPDWLSGGAGEWWKNEMVTWHGKVAFDGAWIDMSEVSSFCAGSCGSGNITMVSTASVLFVDLGGSSHLKVESMWCEKWMIWETDHLRATESCTSAVWATGGARQRHL